MVTISSLSKFVTPNVKHGIHEGDSFGRKFKLISKNLGHITIGKINRVMGLLTKGCWMNNKVISTKTKSAREDLVKDWTSYTNSNKSDYLDIFTLDDKVSQFVKLLKKIEIDKNLSDFAQGTDSIAEEIDKLESICSDLQIDLHKPVNEAFKKNLKKLEIVLACLEEKMKEDNSNYPRFVKVKEIFQSKYNHEKFDNASIKEKTLIVLNLENALLKLEALILKK